jgi:hypothetical protein
MPIGRSWLCTRSIPGWKGLQIMLGTQDSRLAYSFDFFIKKFSVNFFWKGDNDSICGKKFNLNIFIIGFHTEDPFKYLTNFRFDERVRVSYNYLQQLVSQ